MAIGRNFGQYSSHLTRQAFYMRQPEVRSGTIEPIRMRDGTFKFKLTDDNTLFDTLVEAREFMARTGLTMSSVVGGTATGGVEDSITARYLQEALEKHDKQASLVRRTYNMDDPTMVEEMNRLRFRDENVFGYMNTDQNQATLFRIMSPKGEWTTSQITNFMRDEVGIMYPFADTISKVNKRAKTLTAAKRAQAAIRDPLVVSIVDETFGNPAPDLLRKGADGSAGINKALDGITEISSHGLNLFIEANKEEEKLLQAALESASTPQRRAMLEASLRKVRASIDDFSTMTKGLRSGDTIANLRMENFSMLVSGQTWADGEATEFGKKLEEMRSKFLSLKGNFIFSETLDEENAKELERLRGIGREDEFVPVSARTWVGNINTDGGGRVGIIPNISRLQGEIIDPKVRGKAIMTAEKHHFGPLFADVQSLASYPEIFDEQYVRKQAESTVAQLGKDVEMLTQRGQIPSTVLEMLEGMKKYGFADDGEEILNMGNLTTREAEMILDMVQGEAGDPTSKGMIGANPVFRAKLLGILQESVTKKGMLKLRTPAGFRAEVVSRMYAQSEDIRKNLKPGHVALDKSGGLIMHESDVVKYYMNFGGFDLDDMLASMLRRDQDGNFKLLAYRNPLARGEWGFFDVEEKHADQMLERMVQNWHDVDQREEYYRLKEDIDYGRSYANMDAEMGLDPAEAQRGYEENQANLERNQRRLAELKREMIPEVPEGYEDIPMREPGSEVIPEMEGSKRVGYRYAGEPGAYYYWDKETSEELVKKKKDSIARRAQHLPDVGTIEDYFEQEKARLPRGTKREVIEQYAYIAREKARMAALSQDVARDKQLGRYVNARTSFDNFMGAHYDQIRQWDDSKIMIYEMEDVVDALTGSSRILSPEDIDAAIKRMTDTMLTSAIEGRKRGLEMGFSPALLENRHIDLGPRFDELVESGYDVGGLKYEDLFERNAIDLLEAYRTGEFAGMAPEDMPPNVASIIAGADTGFGDEILGKEIGNRLQAARDADLISRAYGEGLADYSRVVTYDEMTTSTEEAIRRGLIPADEKFRHVSQRVSGALVETFELQNVEGEMRHVAGARTQDALIELARRYDEMGSEAKGLMLSGEVFTKLYGQIGAGVEGAITTAEEVMEMEGRAVSRTQLDEAFQRLLSEDEYTRLSLMQSALDASETRGLTSLTEEALAAADSLEGTRVVPVQGQMGGLLDPRTFLRHGDDVDPETVGDLARVFMAQGEGADDAGLALMEAAENYFEFANRVVEDPGMDDLVRSMFGERGAARAEHAADVAANITRPDDSKNVGEMVRRLWDTGGGRAMIYGAGALLGIAGVNMFAKREKEPTLEDMQGPAHLPGGNPYTQQRAMPQMQPGQYTPPSAQGMTYEVRADSGGADDGFLRSLGAITGGAVASTIFQDSFTPDLDSLLGGYA